MVDKYVNWANNGWGKKVAKKLGLPQPVKLKRYSKDRADVNSKVLIGAFEAKETSVQLLRISGELPVNTFIAKDGEVYRKNFETETLLEDNTIKFHSLIFDATEIKMIEDLQSVYDFFQPYIRKRIEDSGRVIVIARDPKSCQEFTAAVASRALVGFVKSLGKEVRRGITSQIIYVQTGAEANLQSTIEFLLSYKSAYVSGQVIHIQPAKVIATDYQMPLKNKLALVTGSARGIGRSIAEVLARDGAKVVLLDIESQKETLEKLAKQLNGLFLTLDITAEDTPQSLAQFGQQHDGWDIIVHNAGITKDKMFVNMKPEVWQMVLKVNLQAQQKINDCLLSNKAINQDGRIICVSSIAGIAGNAGQTNYATSKAGVIGLVKFTAPQLKDGITINAVAPGFIETDMTAKIPFLIRELGRRLNAMSQGGLPVDVAETIAWYASPASSGLNGTVTRVCGLMMLGA